MTHDPASPTRVERAVCDPAMRARAEVLAQKLIGDMGYRGALTIPASVVVEMIGAAILVSTMHTLDSQEAQR